MYYITYVNWQIIQLHNNRKVIKCIKKPFKTDTFPAKDTEKTK